MLDILWLFFIISTLQPVIKQRYLDASRQRLIAQIERKRGSRVILLVHREETMSLLGFPVFRYIDINDSEQVLRAIHMTDPDIPLDLILHTPGGLVLAALQIARAIDLHKAKVTAFVPHYSMSGGTLIALAADEIVMCEHAVLGPVDPQLGRIPGRFPPEGDPGEADLGGRRQDAGAWPTRPRRRSSSSGRRSRPCSSPSWASEPGEELARILTEGELDARLSDHVRRGEPVEAARQRRDARRGHAAHGAIPPAGPAAGERRIPGKTAPPGGTRGEVPRGKLAWTTRA